MLVGPAAVIASGVRTLSVDSDIVDISGRFMSFRGSTASLFAWPIVLSTLAANKTRRYLEIDTILTQPARHVRLLSTGLVGL